MAGTAETRELGGETGATPAAALSISSAMSRLHEQFVGRGPRNTRTIIEQDLIVCVLQGGLTTAEQTLRAHHRPDLIAAQRAGLQEAMRQTMIAAVQDITGRSVASYMSADDVDVQLRVEIFLLRQEVEQTDERPLYPIAPRGMHPTLVIHRADDREVRRWASSFFRYLGACGAGPSWFPTSPVVSKQ